MHLDGLKVAVLVTDGYEPSELTEPIAALRDAGAEVAIVSDHDGTVRGKTDADIATVDHTLDTARAERLRRPAAARRGQESRHDAPERARGGIRPRIRRCGQADRRNLPRPVDADRGRRRPRPPRDELPVAEDSTSIPLFLVCASSRMAAIIAQPRKRALPSPRAVPIAVIQGRTR